jgi:hypothetical protein
MRKTPTTEARRHGEGRLSLELTGKDANTQTAYNQVQCELSDTAFLLASTSIAFLHARSWPTPQVFSVLPCLRGRFAHL